jgi:hypothetical protein
MPDNDDEYPLFSDYYGITPLPGRDGIFPFSGAEGRKPDTPAAARTAPVFPGGERMGARKDSVLVKDQTYLISREGVTHVVSENYSYKSDTYYAILSQEMKGVTVAPSSQSVLDANVVPICLEKARLAGIEVCEWGISHSYVPFPALLYGINYFASSSDYHPVAGPDETKAAIKHVTNCGKYPFCYQGLGEGDYIHRVHSIFGRISTGDAGISRLAGEVYELFRIPLQTLVVRERDGDYAFSSLAPCRYSALSRDEKVLLQAYIERQEFL